MTQYSLILYAHTALLNGYSVCLKTIKNFILSNVSSYVIVTIVRGFVYGTL